MTSELLIQIIGLIIAYLLGSFSSSVWIGKWFFKMDVRQHGSGNAGATNTIRVLGTWPGVAVMIIDVLKSYLAVTFVPGLLGIALEGNSLINYQILLGSFAVIGHVFPLYTGFRGGKGVASLVGVVIALYNPYIFLIILIWFTAVFIATRYVSLGSVTASILFPILAIFVFHENNIFLIILAVLIAVFIPLTHHKNILRLLKGEENKLNFKKKE